MKTQTVNNADVGLNANNRDDVPDGYLIIVEEAERDEREFLRRMKTVER